MKYSNNLVENSKTNYSVSSSDHNKVNDPTNNTKKDTKNVLAAGGDLKLSKLSQSSIIDASANVNKYIAKYKILPNYISISGYKFSMPEFLYLLSKTIQYKYKHLVSDITVKYNVKNPSKPTGTNVYLKLSSKSYYGYAVKIANYIAKHSTAPNYLSISSAKIQYQTIIYAFVKVLSSTKSNKNVLPSAIRLNVKTNFKINNHVPKYAIQVSSKTKTVSKTSSSIYNSNYLEASKNCQVNDKQIKSLSYQITKKYESTYQKAKAIYNWVRDKVSYSFYYNTKYGAKKTMLKRAGNCVDEAHLIVALSRASGIAARYVHGTCKFISGNVYGHVWAQILVEDKWVVADPTSSRNSFGVIRNWYTSSYDFKGVYSSLSF